MMTMPRIRQLWAERVSAALAATASNTQSLGPDSWSVVLPETPLQAVRVCVAKGYLRLVTELGELALDRAWPLLKANACLGGLVKFALTREQRVALQAELPLVEGIDLPLRLQQTCGGLGVGAEIFHSAATGTVATTSLETAGSPDTELKQLCQQTGWPFVERATDRVTVPLEVSTGPRHAVLTRHGAGIVVVTDLAAWDSLSSRSRTALGVLLLAASGFVRLGRAVVAEDDSGSSARLEVIFATSPSVTELASAFCCLSAGVNLCAAQVEALADETAAEDFLMVRANPCTTAPKTPTEEKV